ncbi:hypothetical protein ACHAWF_012158 [Thalassiosira exigua]
MTSQAVFVGGCRLSWCPLPPGGGRRQRKHRSQHTLELLVIDDPIAVEIELVDHRLQRRVPDGSGVRAAFGGADAHLPLGLRDLAPRPPQVLEGHVSLVPPVEDSEVHAQLLFLVSIGVAPPREDASGRREVDPIKICVSGIRGIRRRPPFPSAVLLPQHLHRLPYLLLRRAKSERPGQDLERRDVDPSRERGVEGPERDLDFAEVAIGERRRGRERRAGGRATAGGRREGRLQGPPQPLRAGRGRRRLDSCGRRRHRRLARAGRCRRRRSRRLQGRRYYVVLSSKLSSNFEIKSRHLFPKSTIFS